MERKGVQKKEIIKTKRAVCGKPFGDENGNPAGRGYFHNTSGEQNVIFRYKMGDGTATAISLIFED